MDVVDSLDELSVVSSSMPMEPIQEEIKLETPEDLKKQRPDVLIVLIPSICMCICLHGKK